MQSGIESGTAYRAGVPRLRGSCRGGGPGRRLRYGLTFERIGSLVMSLIITNAANSNSSTKAPW